MIEIGAAHVTATRLTVIDAPFAKPRQISLMKAANLLCP
jgi:hypothetical protein